MYQALLTETVSQYDDELQMMDEEGDIARLVDEFAEGLSKCLAKGQPDSKTRRAWLEALLKAELTDLERSKRIGALIEIALYEGNVARALELLPKVERWAWRDYKWEVAKAAEKDDPQAAIALYKEMAEHAIAG